MAQRKDFTGLNDWYMDTAQYNIDPAFINIFLKDPKEIDQRRFNGYRYYMDFYRSRQWEEQGEWLPEFGSNQFSGEEFNRRTWNVAANLVDKLVTFLVQEPWTIKLPAELEPEEVADEGQENPIHDILEQVWHANNRERFSYEMAQMGCISGDCFVKVSYDEDFYAEGVGELRFEVLDSRVVLPFWDDMDRKKMIGARIQYPIYQIGDSGEKEKQLYTEIHTANNVITVIDGDIQNVAPNPLGELLVIHIKNEPLPFEKFGRSDLSRLIPVQKEFNEKLSDFSEILAYHAAPITIIKGARVQNLQKGARKVWGGIPKDGAVEHLNLDADLSSSLEYLDRLKKQMHESASVPEETLGEIQSVSNTSGSALHLQYQPIVERIRKKQICYGEGLVKLNELILKFYSAIGSVDLPEDIPPALRFKTSIQWGDALPRDRSIDLADISTEIGLLIESRRGALKRLGEENPDAKLEEIKQEQMEQAEMDFMTTGLSGFGDPSAGPDGMGGQPGAASGADDGTQNDVSGAVKAAKTNPITQGSQTSVQAVKKSAQQTTGANKTR